MSPPTIRGLEIEVEELSFRWVMKELSIRGEVCSCAREVSNCGERWWWGDVVRGGGGEGAVVSKKWWSCGESSVKKKWWY
ncbi:hypothetical protein Tco_0842878 [Tanacetum coccineum]|uniref:Uncharacterized protein n=1 Tax=Tanacetum coccineum TaxID=301880 RepID=A0ABQ5B4L4_9ASTR